MRIAVAGATNWGLTLAWLLARDGHQAVALARSEEEAREIDERRGIERLPGLVLPQAVAVRWPESLEDVDGLVVALPVRFIRDFAARLSAWTHVPVVSGTKGIEHKTGKRVSEILADLGWDDISVVSGPTLAREVVRGLPAAAVVASEREESAMFWQERLASPAFRTYRSQDVIGVEICAAYKNVVAIAAGASSGLEFGANTMAAIMTRGLAEVTRLGLALGAQRETFGGLAGVGDLAATCFSPLSRNHQLGERLARRESPESALAAIGEAVEGAATAPVIVELGQRNGVELPIAEQVAAVMEGRATVHDAMQALLSRSLKAEDV